MEVDGLVIRFSHSILHIALPYHGIKHYPYKPPFFPFSILCLTPTADSHA